MNPVTFTLILIDKLNKEYVVKEFNSEDEAEVFVSNYPKSNDLTNNKNYDIEYSIVFGVEISKGYMSKY